MPNTSGPWTPFGQTDDYATGDANYLARGIHVKKNIAEMLAITPKRRKGVYTENGANPTPDPTLCFVKDKGDGKAGLYFLKTEPGTEATTLAHWELWVPVNVAGGVEFQGMFDPATATLANGTGTNGHFYIAKADGSFNGESYVAGDWTIYDGAIWRRLPVGIAALPPAAHTHNMEDVAGLLDALANKIGTGDITTTVYPSEKLPTAQAVMDYTYSKDEVGDRIANAKSEAKDEVINDTVRSTDTTYSSDKIEEILVVVTGNSGAPINDNTPSGVTTYSGNKIENLFDTYGGVMPLPPTGVSWEQMPTIDIFGDEIYIDYGIVNNNGTSVPIEYFEAILTPLAAGTQQPYTLVANYLAVPAVLELIAGSVVPVGSAYTLPNVPSNRLWTTYFIRTEDGFKQLSANPVTSVSVNGVTKFPDQNGLLPLGNVAVLDRENTFTQPLIVRTSYSSFIVRGFQGSESFARFRLMTNGYMDWKSDADDVGANLTYFGDGLLVIGGKLDVIGGFQENGVPLNVSYGIVYKTGTIVDFVAMTTHFNTIDTPGSGNITPNLTGAIVGHCAVMFHNSGVEPTIALPGVTFNKISGTYALGETNRILMHYVGGSTIDYMIM